MFFCQEREVMRGNQPAHGIFSMECSTLRGLWHRHTHACTHMHTRRHTCNPFRPCPSPSLLIPDHRHKLCQIYRTRSRGRGKDPKVQRLGPKRSKVGQLGQGQEGRRDSGWVLHAVEGRRDSGWALRAVEGRAIMSKELLVMLGGCHMQWEGGESK